MEGGSPLEVRSWLGHGAVGMMTQQLHFLGTCRIFCPRGRYSYTKISRLGVGGERGVGGIGGVGVGKDGVDVGEVVELFPAEVACVVSSEL